MSRIRDNRPHDAHAVSRIGDNRPLSVKCAEWTPYTRGE